MERTKFIFHQFKSDFFKPLSKKYRFLTVSASLIIGLAFYLGIDIGLAEMVRQNSYDMHMLAAELLTDSGPYTHARSEHAEMVKRYTEHLEDRHLAVLLRLLFPTLSPEKALASASKGLDKAEKEKEAKEAIWQAGMVSNRLYLLGMRFPRSPSAWFDSEVIPEQWLEDLDCALAESRKAIGKLQEEQTPNRALESCTANRKTILLLFPVARLGSNREEIKGKIEEFRKVVVQAEKYTRIVANKKENIENREQILEWADSEQRRVEISKAMLDKDMERVCELLTEAIEKAFEKEKANVV